MVLQGVLHERASCAGPIPREDINSRQVLGNHKELIWLWLLMQHRVGDRKTCSQGHAFGKPRDAILALTLALLSCPCCLLWQTPTYCG